MFDRNSLKNQKLIFNSVIEHKLRENLLVKPQLLRTNILDIVVCVYDIMKNIKCYVLLKKIVHIDHNDKYGKSNKMNS